MKIIFKRVHFLGGFVVLPRAENMTEAEKVIPVSLARAGGEKCVFPLGYLEGHDNHTPGWLENGSAPPGSSAEDMTADKYQERIVETIKLAGANVEAVEVVDVQADPEGNGASEPEPQEPPTDFGTYLN